MKVSLITLLLLLSPGYASAEHWQVYTHSVGEQGMTVDGTLRGKEQGGKRAFFLELVHALLAELNIAAPVSEVPLARGLKLVTEHSHVVLFNLSRTPDREKLVHWVGPTLEEIDYLYENSAAPTGIQTLGDARELPVCILNSSTHDELLVRQGFTRLKRHNSYSGCFRMLAAGRVQLVASADGGLAQKLAEAQVAPSQIRATPVVLGHDQGFIALSKDTPANEVLRWQVALDKVRSNGQYQALYHRYVQ